MAAASVERDIYAVLSDIRDVLDVTMESEWKQTFSRYENLLRRSVDDAAARQRIIREMLRLYGGMNSFNDLVLQDSRGARPENAELDRLRHELHGKLIEFLE
ncbi:hypothetical protein [Amycolatopsis sp. FDAARGOS 1241]|uniref:DUF6966 domain-containing protein n=1 Tax=Amycolatopsis sp. FDAARGOS 1241 TaxID=2778070 RepID=UPI001950970E|nr:hypothetical protein [Amycolatopsis sp. FDAARGOS 1241]QRP49053.1 hypothetical protein I6J71_15395 [Amycolatopsis sp. FDAARGOS 1241]